MHNTFGAEINSANKWKYTANAFLKATEIPINVTINENYLNYIRFSPHKDILTLGILIL
jgi:hypothetical protein